MRTVKLTDTQVENIILALSMRNCYIETGNISLRANDAIRSKQPAIIKQLSKEQRQLIIDQEDLVEYIINQERESVC